MYKHFLDCVDIVGEPVSAFSGYKQYVSTGAIDCDHIDTSQIEKVEYSSKPSRANLKVAKWDIIFAKMMETQKTLLISEENVEKIYSTGFCAVHSKSNVISPRCLYHLVSSNIFLSQKDKYCSGATQKAITNLGLQKIIINIPDFDEQEKIADILDKVTALISIRKKQLEKLDELVKSRFLELFGDMLLNSMGWSEKPLDTIADIVSGITKGRKVNEQKLIEVPYMAVSNVKAGYIDWTTVKTILATEQEIKQYRLLPDDVLMTEGGDPDKVGRGAIIRKPLENCIHQNHIFRVRLNEEMIFPTYFSEYLQHQKSKRYFLGCAKQTTGIASINMKQLRALPVLLPPLELQKQFSTFCEQTDKSKAAIQKSLEQLETLKKSLMQKYFG